MARVSTFFSRVKSMFKKDPNYALRIAKGVIHVGANSGQEAGLYSRHGLPVVWVEPNPEVFVILTKNLLAYPDQQAVKELVTDLDNIEYPFHLANNNGESSSILEMNLHQEIWPEVKFERTINLRSSTLPSLLLNHRIDIGKYDMLVMDTQGSELLILKGAIPLLNKLKYIKTEAPDFESYKNCCQVEDLETFLRPYGFREYSRHRFARRRTGGCYYDIVYVRDSPVFNL